MVWLRAWARITGGAPNKYQTYEYTLATSTWASGTGLYPSPYPTFSPTSSGRAFGGAASHGSSMYVFGGKTSTNGGFSYTQELSPNSPVGTSYWQSGAYLYRPGLGAVQNFGTTTYQPTSMPTPTVLIAGGQTPTSGGTTEMDMLMTWTLPDTEELPNTAQVFGANKYLYGSAFVGSVLYITGGSPTTSAVHKYTVSTSAWASGTSMPSSSTYSQYTASVDSKLYSCGGARRCDVEKTTPGRNLTCASRRCPQDTVQVEL